MLTAVWPPSIQSLGLHHEKLSKYSSETSTASNCQAFFTSAMKSLEQGQLPGWICECQAGIQGFGAVPWGVLGPSSLLQRVSVKHSVQGPPQDMSLQQGTDVFRPLNSLFFQICSNSTCQVRHKAQFVGCSCGVPPQPWAIPAVCAVLSWGSEVPVQLGVALAGWQPGCEASPAGFLLCKRRSCMVEPSGTETLGMFCELMLVQSRKSKCQCCEMQKKEKALVSWDKAFCSRGKANEIISVTQDLVRMFCIYGIFCAVHTFPCGSKAPQFLQVHSLLSLWILGCRPVRLSWNRAPILFPTLPTTSGNLLTTFCENLEIKHSAVLTNPQTQRLHFKNDWCVWVLSYFFLLSWMILPSPENRSTQRSEAKGLLPVRCCWSVPGAQDCGEMLNLPGQGTGSPCWGAGVWEQHCFPRISSHFWFLIPPEPGFSLHQFILQDPHALNARQLLQPKAAGQELLAQGDSGSPTMGFEAVPAPDTPAGAAAAPGKPPWLSEQPQQFIMSSLAAECCVWGLWLSEAGFHLSLPKAI